VAGAYHSRLMQTAQDKLAAVLAETALATPRCTVVSNFAAKAVSTAEDIRETLTKQVTGSVRWVECMQSLIAAGHTRFIELGPDGTLAGLMGKIDKSVQVITIKDVPSLEAAIAALTA
jgi:[acyl-carrier-protein] S-malonyltransferase